MQTSNAVKNEQAQHHLPCLIHHFDLSGGDFSLWGTSIIVRDMGLTAIGALNLVKRCCSESNDVESLYYGCHSARMITRDIEAVLDYFYLTNHDDNTKVIQGIIQPALSRAKAVISLLCNQFEDDDNTFNSGVVAGSIDTATKEIDEIIDTLDDLHKASNNDQFSIKKSSVQNIMAEPTQVDEDLQIFCPDMSHRYLIKEHHPSVDDLYETIDWNADIAIGVIELLKTQYKNNNGLQVGNNSVLAVVSTIEDSQRDTIAIINGFYEVAKVSDYMRSEANINKIALPAWLLPKGVLEPASILREAIQHGINRAQNALNVLNAVYEKIEHKDINNKVIYSALESAKEEHLNIKTAVTEFSQQLKQHA